MLASQDEHVRILPFIRNMNDAYSMADVIVSRAGALAIAELAVVGVPTILVPFPFAEEDHQTYNAKALSTKGAAVLIPDSEAKEKLMPSLMQLLENPQECEQMGQVLRTFAQPDAIDRIYEQIEQV